MRLTTLRFKGQGQPATAREILWTPLLLDRGRDLNQNLHKFFLQSGQELIRLSRSWVQISQKNLQAEV